MYLINHLPTPLLLHKSPFECLYHKLPNYSTIHVFGAHVFLLSNVLIPINYKYVLVIVSLLA